MVRRKRKDPSGLGICFGRLERTAAPRTVVTQPVRKEGGRKATPKAKPAPVPAPVAASSAKPNEIRRTDVARRTEASCRTEVSRHTESQIGLGAGSRRCLVCHAERDPTYRCCPSYRGVLPNRGVPPYRRPNRPRCQLPSLPRLPRRTRSDVPMLPVVPRRPAEPRCPAIPKAKPAPVPTPVAASSATPNETRRTDVACRTGRCVLPHRARRRLRHG